MIKKIFLLFVVLFMLVIGGASANEMSLKAKYNSFNDEYLSSCTSEQLSYKFETVYLALEYFNESELRYGGQLVASINMTALSIGFEKEFELENGSVGVYAQVGYYLPKFSLPAQRDEGFFYRHAELIHGVDTIKWERYRYELHPGYGGEFGVNVNHQITDNISMSIGGGYRVLKLREAIIGDGQPAPGHQWRTLNDKDMGGYTISLGVEYQF